MSLALSSEQRAIVEAKAPKLLVRAGAGAGKTTVLTERYMSLVTDRGLMPDQILTITFTRKAAAEMKGRIVGRLKALGLREYAQMAETGPIQTIDSFCERILRENALAAGLDPAFRVKTGQSEQIHKRAVMRLTVEELVANEKEQDLHDFVDRYLDLKQFLYGRNREQLFPMLESIMETIRCSEKPRSHFHNLANKEVILASWENELRQAGVDEEGIADLLSQEVVPLLLDSSWAALRIALEAADRLDQELLQAQELDFALMSRRAVDLLEERPEIRERLADQYLVVMVDEAQDMSPIQHLLVDRLPCQELLYVGDYQQSIFGFRGADAERFLALEKTCTTLPLSRNYRSKGELQRFFDRFFGQQWQGRYLPMNPDPVSSDDPFETGSVSGLELWDVHKDVPQEEATAQGIEALKDEGFAWSDIMVLAKDTSEIERISAALGKHGIPNRRNRGTKFYSRQEVRDVANLLTAAADPRDDFAMLALLRSPFVDLSLDAIAILGAEGNVCHRLAEIDLPLEFDRQKISLFLSWWPDMASRADRLTAWEVLGEALAKSPYLENIAARPRADEVLANVRKLLINAANDPVMDASGFAELINQTENFAVREKDADTLDSDADAVQLMTIHSAKGLGAKCVVVWLPRHKQSIDTHYLSRDGSVVIVDKDKNELFSNLTRRRNRSTEAELERLVYVAMTRAMERLCVVHCQSDNKSVWCAEFRSCAQALEGFRVRQFLPEEESFAR